MPMITSDIQGSKIECHVSSLLNYDLRGYLVGLYFGVLEQIILFHVGGTGNSS